MFLSTDQIFLSTDQIFLSTDQIFLSTDQIFLSMDVCDVTCMMSLSSLFTAEVVSIEFRRSLIHRAHQLKIIQRYRQNIAQGDRMIPCFYGCMATRK